MFRPCMYLCVSTHGQDGMGSFPLNIKTVKDLSDWEADTAVLNTAGNFSRWKRRKNEVCYMLHIKNVTQWKIKHTDEAGNTFSTMNIILNSTALSSALLGKFKWITEVFLICNRKSFKQKS